MKRKLIAFALSAAMVMGIVTGCGSSAASQTTASSQEETSAASSSESVSSTAESTASESKAVSTAVSTAASTASSTASTSTEKAPSSIGGYKIGFWYTPASDPLSAQFRAALNYCADLTNCQMEFYDMPDWSSEAQSTAVETLVSNGCDGIIMMVGSSPATYEYLNDNQVYYSGFTRSHTDEVAKVADPSEYCCGWVDEGSASGNVATGYNLTKALADNGCKNIAYVSGDVGLEVHDDRVKGIENAAKDLNINIVANYRGSSDTATGMADLLSTYGSQIDGLVWTGGSDTAIAAVQAAGYLGKIKIAQADTAGADTETYLEQGILAAITAGNATQAIQMYMQIFNGLSGSDRLFDQDKIIPMIPVVVINGIDDWKKSTECLTGDIPGLLPSEILALNSKCTPNTTVEEKEALVQKYSSSDYWNLDAISKRVNAYLGK